MQLFTTTREFISEVYYRNHAFIDVDDYVMHAFRIPKPKNSDRTQTATNLPKEDAEYIYATMIYGLDGRRT